MSEKHILRIKKDYFDLTYQGEKTLDVRVGYGQIKKIKVGDVIEYDNYKTVTFDVIRIKIYDNIEEMLDNENYKKILPGKNKSEMFRILQEAYPLEKENLGIYVIELKKHFDVQKEAKILLLSNVKRKSGIAFSDLINKVYVLTEPIHKIYPDYLNWYFGKVVPGLLDGSREILVCTINKSIAGIVILKKDPNEKKICSCYIPSKFEDIGVLEKLLKKSFEILYTKKPLISISEYSIYMFEEIIKTNNWEQTQVLPVGYYNDSYKEFVFNGEISKQEEQIKK
jgi:ASC-1-like (ASCH) protein